MSRRLGRVGLCVLVVAGLATMCQSASAQWRTHYVRRDGLFHVEKYRTGNGLTPAGAGVLTAGINAFAPIVGSLVGRAAPPDETSRDTPRALLPDDYIEEQRRANDLLERTARLVNFTVPGGGASTPLSPVQDGPGATASSPEFGTQSPWAPRPNGAASTSPASGAVTPNPAEGAKNPRKPQPE
jgi:hypothetical protein